MKLPNPYGENIKAIRVKLGMFCILRLPREGKYVYLWLVHVVVWQNPTIL